MSLPIGYVMVGDHTTSSSREASMGEEETICERETRKKVKTVENLILILLGDGGEVTTKRNYMRKCSRISDMLKDAMVVSIER